MKSSAKKIELASVDDLFSTEEGRQDAKLEKIQEIPLSELHPFKNHPFKVKDDEAMMETADSIKQYGVLVPSLVRPLPDGGYQMVSGHRRKRAAELADVDDNIVEFKDGYDTVLGERGVTVSGGQKQRISIARALLKNAPILILDDSVSAVDTSTEQVILKNLRETRAGKTTILIAHRISTIQDMDKIIFMDDGRIVAVGKHDELLERCEEYRKTVELQKLEDEFGGK